MMFFEVYIMEHDSPVTCEESNVSIKFQRQCALPVQFSENYKFCRVDILRGGYGNLNMPREFWDNLIRYTHCTRVVVGE